MKIIAKKHLTYAKDMSVIDGAYLVRPEKDLKIKQAEGRTTNKIRESKTRKEIFEFMDEMMNFMEDQGKSKGQLQITFIFEK